MRNAKVIQFPKEQSTRKRMQNKMQEQKAVLMLSIASVLVVTVFLNQYISQGPVSVGGDANRNVASFEPATFAKDVKWEHHLAKELSSDLKTTAQLAETPTVRDELIFGFLEGKYGMKLASGRIQSLEFIDAQAGEQPLAIDDKASFLNKFADAFGLKFTSVSPKASAVEGEQVYNLIDSDKRIVATAHFVSDEQGRVSAINIQQ